MEREGEREKEKNKDIDVCRWREKEGEQDTESVCVCVHPPTPNVVSLLKPLDPPPLLLHSPRSLHAPESSHLISRALLCEGWHLAARPTRRATVHFTHRQTRTHNHTNIHTNTHETVVHLLRGCELKTLVEAADPGRSSRFVNSAAVQTEAEGFLEGSDTVPVYDLSSLSGRHPWLRKAE